MKSGQIECMPKSVPKIFWLFKPCWKIGTKEVKSSKVNIYIITWCGQLLLILKNEKRPSWVIKYLTI